MDYEKKYNEALERARKIHDEILNNEILGFPEQIREIFPQLRESEDERIIEGFYKLIRGIRRDGGLTLNKVPLDKCEAWLEKQKENPKNAISIPADCATNAKCEDRWHKTANSLPDDGRDVLAKDAIGNYLLASFDGAQWFVSVYDGEDHPVLHTPPILEWCEIPSEKQKEQKPAEWSEEDADILNCCISSIEEAKENRYAYKETDGDTSYDREIAWLKSLRPSWKPSEEQMSAFKGYIEEFQAKAEAAVGGWNNLDVMIRLYEQLKKL